MFGRHLPDQENTSGARWNPSGVAAIYLSCTRDGAIAEGDHAISIQPLRPRARRVIYPVEVTLARVLDLRDSTTLHDVGLTHDDIAGDDLSACQEVGAAVDWLEHDGLLVQSARSSAMNLVIYPAHRRPDALFEYSDGEEIS
jgi:RES domain-containing protein